jgi:hypothetical protein
MMVKRLVALGGDFVLLLSREFGKAFGWVVLSSYLLLAACDEISN